MPTVFISYDHEDQTVVEQLDAETGLYVGTAHHVAIAPDIATR